MKYTWQICLKSLLKSKYIFLMKYCSIDYKWLNCAYIYLYHLHETITAISKQQHSYQFTMDKIKHHPFLVQEADTLEYT